MSGMSGMSGIRDVGDVRESPDRLLIVDDESR
jgi:hypothetical protein